MTDTKQRLELIDNSIDATSNSINYLLRDKYIARRQGYVVEERQLSDLIDNMQKTLKLLVDMREKYEELLGNA